jgi:DNA-binding NtrC family response regulator
MSHTTGNTTAPVDRSTRSTFTPAPTHTVAVVVCHCLREPHRVGQVAFCDPKGNSSLVIGRSGDRFFIQRPEVMIDCGRLRGDTLSREQLDIRAEGDGARIWNVGTADVKVDGVPLPKGHSTVRPLGAVIEIVGHSVLLLTRRPVTMPAPHAGLLPLHAFGEADAFGLAGESPLAYQQREDIVRAAERGRPVLVVGDTGTGKELVARGIHARSARAAGPFLPVNCRTLTDNLAALRLFGGIANWPNPGTPKTSGYLEDAAGGTLFLDEIGEMEEATQANLLRALERGYTRVGETKERPIPCGIIAATNRGVAGLKFDVGLRFPVIVECPPLAARREDTMQWAQVILRARAAESPNVKLTFIKTDDTGRDYVQLDASLVVGLLRFDLPGNYRQLELLLDASIAQHREGPAVLRWPARFPEPPPAHLEISKELEYVGVRAVLEGLDRAIKQTAPPPPLRYEESREGFGEPPDPSRELVLQALRDNDWNYVKTAKALGISEDKLYRLRKKYGIERPK